MEQSTFDKFRDRYLTNLINAEDGATPEMLAGINEMFDEYNDEDFSYNGFDKLQLKCVNKSNNPMPEYAHDGDSGFDLRAFLDSQVTLKPLERKLIPTGLYFEIPEGFDMEVRPRSGNAIKFGITVLNSPGSVDNQYVGEVKVILINLSNEDFTVNSGDRIAQGLIRPAVTNRHLEIVSIPEITVKTERDSGGFGSTGLK